MWKLKRVLCLALLLLALCPSALATQASAHKIVIALDASKSMDFEFTKDGKRVSATDPEQLRFQAIEHLLASLPEHGYYLGWVVFSTDIDAFQPIQEIRGQADKDRFLAGLKAASQNANGQYTNIPAALEKCVQLLRETDASVPVSAAGSALFLSDGNTDPLPVSSAQKNQALRAARDSGFPIFTMCLNVSGAAEPGELRDITRQSANGGLFEEITDMNDLKKVLFSGEFYDALFSRVVVDIANEVTSDENGGASQKFTVPGFGVKDVVINIDGHVKELWLEDSGGNEGKHQSPQSPEWAVIHLPPNAKPGEWILHTRSDPYAKFKVKLTYDDKLQVSLSASAGAASGNFLAGENAEILLTLNDGAETANKPEQYSGFNVSLAVRDGNGNTLSDAPDTMSAASDGRGYVANYAFSQAGDYALSAVVTISVADSEKPPEFRSNDLSLTVENPPNSAPQLAKEAETSDSVWRFPWNSSYERKITNLAVDREEDESQLRYELRSPAHAQFDPDTRTLRVERLWRGGLFGFSQEEEIVFNITDSGGLSNQATLTVTVHNLLAPFLIVFAVGAAAFIASLLYMALNPPYFHGEISVASEINGRVRTALPIEPSSAAKGKFPLSRFQVDNIGMDYTKCFFIAQRVRKGQRPYIVLKTNQKVTTRKKQRLKRVELIDGIEQRLYLRDDLTKQLRVKYTAKAKQGVHGKRR